MVTMPTAMPAAKTRTKTNFVCSECGSPHPKWAGQCGSCGEWNTLVEEVEQPYTATPPTSRPGPVLIAAVERTAARATPTSIDELDRVLGGGLVAGSVTLLGGEPGIGKSTLLLQLLAASNEPTLYVSAEESPHQVRLRAERLDAMSPRLWLHAETSLPHIIDAIAETKPAVVVIDSIQAVADPALSSPPGSVGQVRGCANRLVAIAKERNVAIVLVGHVTKEGALAGPRTLEHLVDTVLQFEGDRHHALRLLRASKHRFGPTNELGLFEMGESGLRGVPDPSTMFLADRRTGIAGSAVVPTMEGQRPIVVEVQALATPGVPGVPSRRSAQGLDGGRLSMLAAVLARRRLTEVGEHDIYASTAGGAKLREPGLDLGVCLAIMSAVTNRPLPSDMAMFGEVGLGGELRQVGHAARRITEARRLGFRRVLVPAKSPDADADIIVLRASTLLEATAQAGLGGAGESSGLPAV
jgi:DNA repair protein RadA/Sms